MEQRMDRGAMRGLIRFTLEETGRGTRVMLVSEGETGGLLKLADPVVARTLKKQFAADLETLKTLLENQPAIAGAAS